LLSSGVRPKVMKQNYYRGFGEELFGTDEKMVYYVFFGFDGFHVGQCEAVITDLMHLERFVCSTGLLTRKFFILWIGTQTLSLESLDCGPQRLQSHGNPRTKASVTIIGSQLFPIKFTR
jgi:hypothetical protein